MLASGDLREKYLFVVFHRKSLGILYDPLIDLMDLLIVPLNRKQLLRVKRSFNIWVGRFL